MDLPSGKSFTGTRLRLPFGRATASSVECGPDLAREKGIAEVCEVCVDRVEQRIVVSALLQGQEIGLE
jgi:hypothetical protein